MSVRGSVYDVKLSMHQPNAIAVFNFEEYELWVKPLACYYAARASKELKNITDAEFFIGYAGNFKNYFFENKLQDRLSFLSFLLKEK